MLMFKGKKVKRAEPSGVVMRSLVFNANVCHCADIGADGCQTGFGAATKKKPNKKHTSSRTTAVVLWKTDVRTSTAAGTPGWSFRRRWKVQTDVCRCCTPQHVCAAVHF